MNFPGFVNKLVRIINDTFFNHLITRQAILGCPGCLLLAVVSFYGQAQTVTVDFGGRSGSTAVVPSGFFSVGGIGDPLADPVAIATLTSAGLNRTRFWIGLQQVYATSTPDFSVLDSEMQIMSASGVHPIGVIYDTPPSLGSSPCAPPSMSVDGARWQRRSWPTWIETFLGCCRNTRSGMSRNCLRRYVSVTILHV